MLREEYGLLCRTWFPVARLADLGDGVAAGNILGNALVIYRVGDELTVASSVCPHRGMALHYGHVSGGSLECPYHGWLFAPVTGECTAVPSLPAGSKIPRAALRTYPSRIAYGLVWSCLGEPYLPFPGLPDCVDGTWLMSAGAPYDLHCGMRQLTENFRDRAHFPFVHANTMGELEKVVDSYSVVQAGWELGWRSSVKSVLADPDESEQTLDYQLVLPMCASIRVSGSSGGSRLIAQLVTPITADGDQVRQFWLICIDAVTASHGVSIEAVLDYERQIFEEDHRIVENQYPAEAPLELHTQVHSPADRFSIVYRRTYRRLVTEFAAQQSQRP
jgi:phenylpropionate dioxygenase-like ring-hydroxylating dioxygenase large terminal subunit